MQRIHCLITTVDLRGSLVRHFLSPKTVLLTAVLKGNMMILVPLFLLLCRMLPGEFMRISDTISKREVKQVQLSMEEEAVDDRYRTCRDKMAEIVDNTYFKKENNGIFADVWKKAEICTNRGLEKNEDDLTKNHIQAICVYTSGYKEFYDTLNDAVQISKNGYGTSFPFHSIHFWLTTAIQILNPDNRKCLTTYHRSNNVYTGNVNDVIRFGFFTSSSKKHDVTQFGKQTCFKIKTCHGAYLKHYPELKTTEEEVLIPPYERFRITEKPDNVLRTGLPECKVVYVLESAGVQSNLDCHIAK